MRITFVLLLGILACAFIAFVFGRDIAHIVRLALRGKRVKGQIVRDDFVTGLRRPLHYPVVAFRDAAGVLHEVRSRFPKETSFRDQSREVVIAYDPARPDTHAEALVAMHLLPMTVMVLCFFAIAAGLPLLLLSLAR